LRVIRLEGSVDERIDDLVEEEVEDDVEACKDSEGDEASEPLMADGVDDRGAEGAHQRAQDNTRQNIGEGGDDAI
jgi:hypothetical protein